MSLKLNMLRGLLTIAQGASHAASWAMLGESINDDSNFNYNRTTVMISCAVVGGTLEALSTWFFEGAFIENSETLERVPLNADPNEPADPNELEEQSKSISAKLGIGIYTAARFTDILVNSVASYAACKGVMTGNSGERPLAALSLEEYLGVTAYTLISNCSFSFLTEISAQFNLTFNNKLSPFSEKLLRLFFTMTHIAYHATNQIPLAGQEIAKQIGPLLGVVTGVLVANIPVAGTTYLFETREIAKHLTGQNHELQLSKKIAQALYSIVPGPSAILHGAESAMPLVLLSKNLNISQTGAIAPELIVGLVVAAGNWASEGKETKKEILRSLPEGLNPYETCLFLKFNNNQAQYPELNQVVRLN